MILAKEEVPMRTCPKSVIVCAALLLVAFGAAPGFADTGGEIARGPELVTPTVQEELVTPATEATEALYFMRFAATTFVPYSSSVSWVYSGGGCISHTGTGDHWFDIDVQVPTGAELDYVRVYFNDTDGSNDVSAFLFTYDGAGNYTNLATAQSTGTPGFSDEGSGFFSHIVNTTNESISLRVAVPGTTNEVCDVRIRYSY
jgi:hypothetical protein